MRLTRRTTAGSRRTAMLLAVLFSAVALAAAPAVGELSLAVPTARISGEGSSWAGNAVEDWKRAVQSQGVTMDYAPNGSSSGRKDFALGLADFAVSEIPYTGDTKDPQDTIKPDFDYAMLPVVAGGTAFMYNLPVNGQRFEDLKLSQRAVAKIFTGQVTQWNDPVIAVDNPGVNLPAQRINVVVRSDGSGATAQFTLWMLRQFGGDYAALCNVTKCNPGAATSYYPYQGLENFTAQSGSVGVTTYTTNTQYTISYDEYSYAQGVGFPVAQVKNAAGFTVLPTDRNVAVALTQAQINSDPSSENYLAQDLSAVYPYMDPRTYPLSAYSYMIEPTEVHGNFDTAKGETLAYVEQFILCEGQQSMGKLGYSPLPMNLVLLAMDQVSRVPGISAATQQSIKDTKAGVASGTSNPCNNPTFKTGDSPTVNQLIKTAPFPAGCDAACQAPWIGAVSGGPNPTAAVSETADPGSTGSQGGGGTQGGKGGGGTQGGKGGGGGGAADEVAGTSGDTSVEGGTVGIDGDPTAPTGPGSTGATPVCDPDTGECTGGTATSGTDDGAGTGTGTQSPAAGTGEPGLLATPYALSNQQIWGSAQLALFITLGLALLLVLCPPFLARAFDARRGKSGQPAPSPPTDRRGADS